MMPGVANPAVYFRADDDLRDSLEAFRQEKGLTLSAAVVELLEIGLEAHSDGPSIAHLQRRTSELETELAKRETDVATTRGELQQLRFAYRSLEEHLRRANIGVCPTCHAATSGYEVVVARQCAACHGPLSMAPTGRSSADLLWLVAAIGVALLAYAAIQHNLS
jgi:hypothetical protein